VGQLAISWNSDIFVYQAAKNACIMVRHGVQMGLAVVTCIKISENHLGVVPSPSPPEQKDYAPTNCLPHPLEIGGDFQGLKL
jgi:hypothetical protein